MWEVINDMAGRLAQTEGTKVVCFPGDMGELDTKRRSVQLVTGNKDTILSLVIDTIAPLVNVAERALFIRGTPAHEGKSCWLEETLAKDCDIAAQDKYSASWYHYQGMIGTGRFDIAHHVSIGAKPLNSITNMAERAEMYYHRRKLPLPHVVQRSHGHRYAWSGDNFPIQVVYTPAMTLNTEYSYRIGKELSLSDIGGIYYRIENGVVSMQKWLYEPREERRVWAFRI